MKLFSAAVVAVSLSSLALLAGCGGHSDLLDDGSDSGCTGSTCSAGEAGTYEDVSAPPPPIDATTTCPPIACPAGFTIGVLAGNDCACVPLDAGADATTPRDARVPDDSPSAADGPNYLYDAPYSDDAPYYADAPFYPDSPYFDDAPYDQDACSSYCGYPYQPGPNCTCVCGPDYCGAGYTATPDCACEVCPATSCPSGQTPSVGCGSCISCQYSCPAGFSFGTECNCVPNGVDAGSPDAGGGGVVCDIGGYYGTCTAGEWCELGVCPGTTVEYGCFCNADGTASCNINCPPPPPCDIPGLGTCPYDSSCTFGSCAGDSSGELQCYCYGQDQAYCETVSCGGLDDAGTPTSEAGP